MNSANDGGVAIGGEGHRKALTRGTGIARPDQFASLLDELRGRGQRGQKKKRQRCERTSHRNIVCLPTVSMGTTRLLT